MKLESIPNVSMVLNKRDTYLQVKRAIQDIKKWYHVEDIHGHTSALLPEDVVDNMRAFVNDKIEEIENQIREL